MSSLQDQFQGALGHGLLVVATLGTLARPVAAQDEPRVESGRRVWIRTLKAPGVLDRGAKGTVERPTDLRRFSFLAAAGGTPLAVRAPGSFSGLGPARSSTSPVEKAVPADLRH
jgi:hypothetical protein